MCGFPWQAGNQVGDYLYTPTIKGLWITDVPASPQIPVGAINK